MAIELTKRSVKGSALTHEEVDNNWGVIEEAINGLRSGVVTKTVTLAEGDNTVLHSTGRKARIVTFFLANGLPVEYEWRRKADDQLNAIVVVVPAGTRASELTNTEINILT